MSKYPTRRSILRGLLAGSVVSVGLPPLECMMNATGTAYAGTPSGFPTRFGLFFWGNGNVPDFWTPTGEGFGADWTLSEQLSSLEPMKSKISVVSGLSVKLANVLPHYSGLAGILTGAAGVTSGDESTMAGPTIDQIIANEVGGLTRFSSIESSVDGGNGQSHNGPHAINPAEGSAHALFDRLFGAGFTLPGDTPIIDPKVALRRSVLDAVLDDANRLSARVGAADAARLEQHMDGIRALELRLARMEEDPPNLASCAYPTDPDESDYPEVDGRPQLTAKSRAMCDILVMAYACDHTRVASHWVSRPVGNTLFPGASAGHHNLTHDEPGDQPEVQAIVSQVIAEYNYFLEALDAVPEGTGTLLDHCAILATSDISLGKTHSLDDFPLIIGGAANGYFLQDHHYRSPSQENASQLMLSLTRAMGLNLPSFGDGDGLAEQGLAAIEA